MDSEERERPEKRRRVRKGTHSCWECKRRKVRCTFGSADDTVCIGCTRRCTECVSQELPEQTAAPVSHGRLIGDRFVRVEAMIERLTKQQQQAAQLSLSPPTHSKDDAARRNGTITPVSCHSTPAAPPSATSSHAPTPVADMSGGLHPVNYMPTPPECSGRTHYTEQQVVPINRQTSRLSEALLAVYPMPHDVEAMINAAGSVAAHFIAMSTWDRVDIEARNETLSFMRARHDATSHPIVITRQMLMLAVVTQFISPETHDQERLCLSEPLPKIRKRLAETANRLVLRNQELMDTGLLDGLECIILDGMYQANMGNLRQAWLSWRRAIATAQLMGLNRPHRTSVKMLDPTRKVSAPNFWYRLVWVDRYLCLFLGLPQATRDQSMMSEANLSKTTLARQLERRQCAIAGRIVDRNERDPSAAHDSAETRVIDEMLQEAASKMPSRWWLVPNLAAISDEELLLEEISRLQSQMIHYNLLNLLHLPYVLHSTIPPSTDSGYCTHQYSRITCVNASRDLLKSYIMFRTWNRIACCCRVVDYFALMASMTLLVAHIDSHNMVRESRDGTGSRSGYGDAINILAHQRMTDRALMEEALDGMEAVAKLNNDALNTNSADMLRQLLAIEEEAYQGAQPGASASAGAKHVLRMNVPHMGTISVGPDGAFRRDVQAQAQDQAQDQAHDPSHEPLVIYTFPAGTAIDETQAEMRAEQAMRAEAQQVQQPQPTQAAATEGMCPQQATVSPTRDLATDNASQVPAAIGVAGVHGPGSSGQIMQATPSGGLARANSFQPSIPGLTAGADQWAFQGVDMTFFNSLMREMDMQPQPGEPNSWWPLLDVDSNVYIERL